MKLTLGTITTATLLALSQSPALAAIELTDRIAFSGFGTLGYTRSDDDSAKYRREFQPRGAGESGSLAVDSNLGLQISGNANEWLSATVQTLSVQRSSEAVSTRIEWAFVKAAPIDGLSLRAGKMALQNFMVSDSRRIGYANTALRPANEVYGMDILNGGLQGADVSYRLPLAGQSLTLTGQAGESSVSYPSRPKSKVKDVRGFNAVLEGDWYSLRLGRTEGKPTVDPALLAMLGHSRSDELYSFTGLGLSIDRSNIIVQAEKVRRRARLIGPLLDANAWYVMAGYRLGAFTPFATHANAKPVNSGALPQQTNTLGVRWDVMKNAALKLQFERIDTKDSAGMSLVTPLVNTIIGPQSMPVTEPVKSLGVSFDFVF